VLDDFSRYILAWKLCTTMSATDVGAAGVRFEPGQGSAYDINNCVNTQAEIKENQTINNQRQAR
jgi:transposase InsO family protein